ncbi:MAG: hypothetical protein JO328_03995 [Hyphomicrobiales bacterium]|nr:hypothetical protein [Hyphomicrobiales bacterium]MBV8827218.1 hypothetical protein [Hyphomicrobiales bacterium]MBV9426375.1 hypothetical protein [Bradyrhizobiaceae bacterium]
MDAARPALFRPSGGRWVAVIALGLLALGYAFYMRYSVIQHTPTGLACDAGLPTLLCRMRSATIAIFQHTGFGALALAAAAVNLWRPRVALFALGLVAAALGIVLYNVVLSGIAVALLILSLARPAAAAAR